MDARDADLAAGKHKNPIKRLWVQNSFSIISYMSLVVFIMVVWHRFSDGDFSFLMTLGSVFNLFSFVLLAVKAALTKRVTNVSLKTLECYAVLLVARLLSILQYEGYLPYDKSGDFIYQACEVLTLLLVLGLIAAVGVVFRRSYGEKADAFGAVAGIPSAFGALVLVLPALAIAALLHPRLNNNNLTDTAWAFALYLEAVAIMPQLYMLQHRERSGSGEIEPFEANFVFGLAVARLMHFVFWLSSYHELNDKYTSHFGHKYPGHIVVLSQIVNLLLMGDYCYYYLRASRSKDNFILPSTT